jgi:hypothetical protein
VTGVELVRLRPGDAVRKAAAPWSPGVPGSVNDDHGPLTVDDLTEVVYRDVHYRATRTQATGKPDGAAQVVWVTGQRGSEDGPQGDGLHGRLRGLRPAVPDRQCASGDRRLPPDAESQGAFGVGRGAAARPGCLARFPYYDEDAEFDEIDAVARDLADLIRGIDPEAMADDRFWSTFVDDVEMGDFATQADELRPTDKGFSP